MSKKILFVATVVRMHINVFHIPYLKWFQEQGWETSVAARNDFDDPSDCVIPSCDRYYDIPFERNPFKTGNLKAYKQLRKLIREEKFDIVYCHTPVGAMMARLAAKDERKFGTKVVYMAHGFHFFKGAPLKNWLIYYPSEKFLSRFTDMILTINMEDYHAAQKFHAGSVAYVPGVGIDLSRFQPDPEIRKKLRNELGIKENKFVLMSVGELSERKNQIDIVRALGKLKREDLSYVICGDGSTRNTLIEEAEKAGISDQLILLGFRHDVNVLYNIADVFVFPSLQEGLPVALMEAMAMGLPAIASDIRGNEDLIDAAKGGYLIQKHDVRGYANAIYSMALHRDRIAKIGKYNQMKVQKYGLDSVVKEVTDTFKGVM